MPATSPYLTDDHHSLREQVKSIADAEIAPRVPDMESRGPHTDRELRPILGQWLGLLIGSEWGGRDAGHLAKTVAVTEASRVSGAAGAILQASVLGSAPVIEYGSDEMRRRWLPAIADGSVWPSIAVTEAHHGSHLLDMDTTARFDGGDLVIDGAKEFIGNADLADIHCVVVRTGERGTKRGLTAVLVEADRNGVDIVRQPASGLYGFSVDRLCLDGVRVPEANIIGEVGAGRDVALMASVVYGRLNLAAVALGIHQQALDVTTTWVSEKRERYNGHLADVKMVRRRLAKMSFRLMQAELAAYHGAYLLDQGEPCDRWLYNAKLVNNRHGVASAEDAKQLHGGHATRIGNPCERILRDIQLINAPAGPDDIQLKYIADDLLAPARHQWSAQHASRRRAA
ncbi:acyl-CoA dehydrogenase family protein [Streptomyces sp. WI04-05B]|uniref:Acyl-CoA dehydrogenase n=1 Tax=Streptomyces turgidiscabies (strain Car8) TaxID=698760 RepID=L7F4N4_STRT8|nr:MULTISPECIES: acyl-CoA dehydrogenase family protein [Streptomyces]ELP65976.1 acyl-CoA dehydrogenase [Streptomyces turgidiscabies Car8]MDX2549009.1 acyl-CoA dehydrogenase family protein [Streptomyces sp. WI04-05B]MDX2590366.1 acyl-CoA dehydrogenase family protein [Streptomyces sp. WI04-05A]MDX3500250.1 acyl-CoA dehydrogenase family protein [Streptomyces turgidiscabies]GAQ75936.1 acyl-CoA dehydrogenase [Streptomyces turgidiscabies]